MIKFLINVEVVKLDEATYVTGVVIANGVPDSDGDCLDKKDIKKIFTKYLDRATDVMHTRIKNEGVEVLANWITESDTQVNGQIVPAGSWMATFAITNEELLSSINDGSISGLSLGSVSEDAMTKKYWFINKSINYQDLDDMEEVIPLFISFVDHGANQYGLEIMDYNVYINKNDKTGEKMTEEEIATNEDAMIPISALAKLREFFSFTKPEAEETPEVNKQEEDVEEPVNDDISNKELLEQLPGAVAQAVKEAINEAVSNPESEADIDKADDAEEEEEEKEDVEINKSKDEKPESGEEPEDEESEQDDVEINKRQTSMTDIVVNDAPSQDFYQRTHRDHLGRKIRN